MEHVPTFWFSQYKVSSEISGRKVYVYPSNLKPLFIANLSLNLGSTVVVSTVYFLVLMDFPLRVQAM